MSKRSLLRSGFFLFCFFLAATAQAQSLPKIRAAYTSIAIQMTPLYLMKELDLPRKHGLDVELLYIPVSSRAVQAALAGEISFLTSGGVANINANMGGADFVGLTATLNTFTFKILSQPEIRELSALRGKRIGISRLGGASDFSIRYALDRWGLAPDRDAAILQMGGEPELVAALQGKTIDAAVISEPFATAALRAGSHLLFDLSRLDVPYTLHGIGTRKSLLRERRETAIRYMKAYLEGIQLFKTKKDLALATLKKFARLDDLSLMQNVYQEYSQRLIRAVPYPSPEGIQTILDHLAKSRPQAKTLNANDFIDASILREIEDSGFVKRLYTQ
jgi:ABC-type nitrate/sulfonate/bicarbonate transport system substrate-binding protein